jgi:hypothetical protein
MKTVSAGACHKREQAEIPVKQRTQIERYTSADDLDAAGFLTLYLNA